MDVFEAVQNRHSVRSYLDTPIPEETAKKLRGAIEDVNRESGLHFALFTQELTGFAGKLKNVRNYIAFAGSGEKLEERIGYYGAKFMLEAQMLGLNSCWVAMSFNKGAVTKLMALQEGEKVVNALALGYGETQGIPHRTKPMEKLCRCDGPMPDWFRKGMETVMLAPTAINQQQFLFTLAYGTVNARAKLGPCSQIDLGIVKYYFEIGSGKKVFPPDKK